MLELSKLDIYIELDPSSVTVNTFNEVKIMVKNCYSKSTKSQSQSKNYVKNLGIYINTHFKILYQLTAPLPFSLSSSLPLPLPLPSPSTSISSCYDKSTKILNKFKNTIDIIKRL